MVKPVWSKVVLVIGMLVMVSCREQMAVNGPPVTDQEFAAAVKQAHDTLGVVRQAMLSPAPSNRFIGLKVRFRGENEGVEDHWTEPIDYYNEVFTIRMLDGLTFDTGLHPEQFVEVDLSNVLDWMVVEADGKLIGGYTIRLAYEHMTSEEKKEFLAVTGYVIE